MILSFTCTKCIVYYTFSGCDHSVCASDSTNHARVTSVTLKRWWQSYRSSSGLRLTSSAAAALWYAVLQGGVNKGLLRFYSIFFLSSAYYELTDFSLFTCNCILWDCISSWLYADHSSLLGSKERKKRGSVWSLWRKLVFA